ncbi:MAG: hypothetical protein FWD68_21560, partial [Alphaproteobacteria bacterium]|nr:hypothetical protein [Alphaproteobacteria bacterium]
MSDENPEGSTACEIVSAAMSATPSDGGTNEAKLLSQALTAKEIRTVPKSEAVSITVPIAAADDGTNEARLFSQGMTAEEIARQAAASEHRRTERFRDNFESIAIVTLWVVWIVLLGSGVTWCWHALMP